MNSNKLQDWWISYKEGVLEPDSPRNLMKAQLSFHAGAFAVLHIMKRVVRDNTPDDIVVTIFNNMERETATLTDRLKEEIRSGKITL